MLTILKINTLLTQETNIGFSLRVGRHIKEIDHDQKKNYNIQNRKLNDRRGQCTSNNSKISRLKRFHNIKYKWHWGSEERDIKENI